MKKKKKYKSAKSILKKAKQRKTQKRFFDDVYN
jgi:hypothetical protein